MKGISRPTGVECLYHFGAGMGAQSGQSGGVGGHLGWQEAPSSRSVCVGRGLPASAASTRTYPHSFPVSFVRNNSTTTWSVVLAARPSHIHAAI